MVLDEPELFFCNENWYDDQGNYFNIEDKSFSQSDLRKIQVFHYKIPEDLEIKTNQALCFFTRGLDLTVYITADSENRYSSSREYGTRKVYEFKQNGAGLAGNDIGLVTQIVPLSPTDAGNVLHFYVDPAEHSAFLIHLRIQDSAQFISSTIYSRLLSFVLSLFITFFGFFTVLYTIFAFKGDRIAKTAYYAMGCFFFILGILLLIETQVIQILTGRPELSTTLKYVFMLLLCIPQAVQNDCFSRTPHKKLAFPIASFVTFLLIAETFLNFFSPATFYRLFWISGMIMIFNLGVTVFRLIKDIIYGKKYPHTPSTIYPGFFMVILGLSALLDFGLYFYFHRHITDWGRIIRFVTLLFIFILLIRLLRRSILRNREALLAERYKREARTDALTGLFNKGAFMEREIDLTARLMQNSSFRKKTSSFVIMSLDLNNLKSVNDNLGHAAGDSFIKAAASILRNASSPACEIYRVGGDEFIILIFDEKGEEAYNQLVEKMLAEEKTYNQANPSEYPLSFAYGHALCKKGEKEALHEAELEADQEMYACKRFMKAL